MMKILNNNKKLEIHSSILDNINETNYKITLSTNKNCCKEVTTKVLTPEDVQSISKLFLNGDTYYPGKQASLTNLSFKNNKDNTFLSFSPSTPNNLIVNQTDIINNYNTWKLTVPNSVFKNTSISVSNVANNTTITISNLKTYIDLFSSVCSYIGNSSFSGEITNYGAFHPYEFIGDGIYSFTLIGENLTTGSKTTETGCIAVLDDIKCLIPNVLIKNKNSLAHLLYQSIIDVQECNCMCEDMCDIYNSLYEEIRWN